MRARALGSDGGAICGQCGGLKLGDGRAARRGAAHWDLRIFLPAVLAARRARLERFRRFHSHSCKENTAWR